MIRDNISWLSSSKTGHHFILSSTVVFSLKPMLSCFNSLFSSYLINCNFWILNRVNAVFSKPLLPIDLEFIDHWLRCWNIFVEIGVLSSRYIRSKFFYKSFKSQIIIFFNLHQFVLPFNIVFLKTNFDSYVGYLPF